MPFLNTERMEMTKMIIDELRTVEELDVEQGILYCNGEEGYLEILRAYCEDWESNGTYIKDLFEKKDWKNYTVAVHGLKSSLFSIGVNRIAELAKQLEFAGKENRIDYIEENHAGLMEAYETFFNELEKRIGLCTSEEETGELLQDVKEISGEEFEKIIADMEMAVFAFETDVLTKNLEELEKYSYKGNVLKNVLAPVRRKIEMWDYISAVELLAEQKKAMD